MQPLFFEILGHMCDPEELPGLAHFCEHMLFLGTEKYPVENDYKRFLSEHGKVKTNSLSFIPPLFDTNFF